LSFGILKRNSTIVRQYFDHEYLLRKPLCAADECFSICFCKTINFKLPFCIGENDYFLLSVLSDLRFFFNNNEQIIEKSENLKKAGESIKNSKSEKKNTSK